MDIYLVTLGFGLLAITTTLLALARLLPDDYGRGLPTRQVVHARAGRRHTRG